MPAITIISNTPPPYRVPVFKRLANLSNVKSHVVFCTQREPNRQWDLPPLDFPHTFLKERFITFKGRYIHVNPDVMSTLNKLESDVIVTDGFNPTHLLGFAHAMLKRKMHVAMTDGTDVSEKTLSAVHRAVRRIVYARSRAFIAASVGGWRLYESYGISRERCFMSCLCIDNDDYARRAAGRKQEFDFVFSGRIEPVKNPLFALEVAAEAARRLKRKTRILFVGSGSLEDAVRQETAKMADTVDAVIHGHAAQGELPALYASARLFLFPTSWDPWGVVANEACAAGLPVMTTPEAGVAGELVVDGVNGFVYPLDVKKWGERAAMLLSNGDVHSAFARQSLALVDQYSIENAALGIRDACRFALNSRDEGAQRRAMGRL